MKEKKIKLLGIYTFFYPHRGGSQKYAEEIYSKLLNNHSNIEIDILAYNTDNSPSFENYRGFNITRISCYHLIKGRFAFPKIIPLIKFLYNSKNKGYTHINTGVRFFDPSWWVPFYAKLIGAKSIYTGHCGNHPIHENKLVEKVSYLIDKTIATISLKFFDIHTYISKYSYVFATNNLGVKKNLNLVYNGVDVGSFNKKNIFKNIKSKKNIIPNTNYKIKNEDIIITFIGRVTWTKGVDYFMSVAKEILDEIDLNINNYNHINSFKNVKFVIAGPGDLLEKMKKESKDYPNIFVTGSLNYKQVQILLSQTTVFVNPSHHNEGLPTTLLEAGASKCFVIATDNAGTKEVIIDKIYLKSVNSEPSDLNIREIQTGYLIPQKDPKRLKESILKVLNLDIKDRELIINNLYSLVEKQHDWDNIAEEFYKIL